MEVFCSESQTAVLNYNPRAAERVLPLPMVLDSHAVVLLHLLLQEQLSRPVSLDASGVQRMCPIAALLLTATFRARQGQGTTPRIVKLSYALRKQLHRHPLTEYIENARPDETVFAPAAQMG
ncbi:MAG: hypothetical protein H0X65_03595 [Gemmatimonadetes bacterium]|nr:hypothetical protein [Gemmatimonadota bacterium]